MFQDEDFLFSGETPLGTNEVSVNALPTLIIGLGDSGTSVIHHIINSINPAELRMDAVRFLCINTDGCNDTSRTSQVVYLNLLESAETGQGFQRSAMPDQFRSSRHYNELRQHINNKLNAAVEKHRIFIVSSIAEEEVAIIGDVLYLLKNATKGGPAHSIYVLLSLDAPNYSRIIRPEERYAILRELSRFHQQGRHVFGIENENIIEGFLFHYYFIFGSDRIVSEIGMEDSFLETTAP